MTTFVPAPEFTCPKCRESDCFLVSATCTAFVWGVGELQDVDNIYWEDDSEATCNNDGTECDWEGTVAGLREAAATVEAAQDAASMSEKTYDVLVTVNNDWLVFPSGHEGPLGWIARGVTERDLEDFQANDNLARDFIDAADPMDVVEIAAPWGQDSAG